MTFGVCVPYRRAPPAGTGTHPHGRRPHVVPRGDVRVDAVGTDLAVPDGAEVIDARCGVVVPGLVLLRTDRPNVAPVHDPVSTVVLQCDRAHVDTVLVAGRAQVRGGRSVADEAPLVDEARDVAARLAQSR